MSDLVKRLRHDQYLWRSILSGEAADEIERVEQTEAELRRVLVQINAWAAAVICHREQNALGTMIRIRRLSEEPLARTKRVQTLGQAGPNVSRQ